MNKQNIVIKILFLAISTFISFSYFYIFALTLSGNNSGFNTFFYFTNYFILILYIFTFILYIKYSIKSNYSNNYFFLFFFSLTIFNFLINLFIYFGIISGLEILIENFKIEYPKEINKYVKSEGSLSGNYISDREMYIAVFYVILIASGIANLLFGLITLVLKIRIMIKRKSLASPNSACSETSLLLWT